MTANVTLGDVLLNNSRCVARVPEPPWYFDDHRCKSRGRLWVVRHCEAADERAWLCGTHARKFERRGWTLESEATA